jgi:putative FmdB family regulatory protein
MAHHWHSSAQSARRIDVPTYQYACTACGHAFDAVQSFSDPTLTECPECHGRLRKVFSSVGVVFKGSGFYRNDSRAPAGGAGGAAAESGTSEPKTDAKPATTSEPATKSSGSGSTESAGASTAASSSPSPPGTSSSSRSSTTGTAA